MTTRSDLARLLGVMHFPNARMEFVAMGGPDLVVALERASILQAQGRVWSLPCRQTGEVECERAVRERYGQYIAVCGRQGDPCHRDDRVDAEDVVELTWNAAAWSGWLREQCGLLSRQTSRVLPAGALLLGDKASSDGTRRSVYWLPDPRALDAPQFFADLVIGEAGRPCWVLLPDLGRVPADRDAGLRAVGVHVVEIANRVSCDRGRLLLNSASLLGHERPSTPRSVTLQSGPFKVMTQDQPDAFSVSDKGSLVDEHERLKLFIDFSDPQPDRRQRVWTALRPGEPPGWVLLSEDESAALFAVIAAEGRAVGGRDLTSGARKPVDHPAKALERARLKLLGAWKKGRGDWLPSARLGEFRWAPPTDSLYTVILRAGP